MTGPSRKKAKPGKAKKAARARPRAGDAPAFPLRVACIDVGSNAIRFGAAEFSAPTRFRWLATERVPVRLGHDVFLTGQMSPEVLDAAAAAMAGFRRNLDALGIARYRAVATSATREARNGQEFVDRAREAGIALETITGSEEGRLVHVAVRHKVPLGRRPWVLVDIGGGSVEVSLADEAGPHWVESHSVGSVRLLEELQGAASNPGAFRRLLEEYAAVLRIPATAREGAAGFIVTGGNMESLAQLAGVLPRADGVSVVTVRALRSVTNTLSRLSYRQRVTQLGLKEDRADVVLPAALVIERLAALCAAKEILVPFVGMREGLVLDLVDALTQGPSHASRADRIVEEGALRVGRHYFFDEEHAQHVAALSTALFDQLCALHGYGVAERRLLRAAALLHDIGTYVSGRKHHKHTQYLVSQSDLPGMTPREIELTAAIARYHRKGDPSPAHLPFGTLPDADRTLVLRLGALIRLAEAMDREHRRRVKRVRATATGKRLTLELHGAGDLLLERWALRRKSALFQKAFGLKVAVRAAPGSADADA